MKTVRSNCRTHRKTSRNISPKKKTKAALRGIKVVPTNSYAQGEERPYGNTVYTRTAGVSATGTAEVVGRFDGGMISSDAGGLLLREVEKRFGILKRFAACFRDYRDPQRIEHSLATLISQRVYGIALGYEDLNDHDSLRHDVVMGVLCDKNDPSGMERVTKQRDQGKAVGGQKHTESVGANAWRCRTRKAATENIVADGEQIERSGREVPTLKTRAQRPPQVVLDVDAHR